MSGSGVSPGSSANADAGLVRAVGVDDGKKGTLQLGSTRLCGSFDPAQSFEQWCQVVLRTYSRTLMSFAGAPGQAGLNVVPDLAVAPPKVSKDLTKWTFTLRDDAKWQTGKPVTATDVQYGIERLFDPDNLGAVSVDTLCLFSACSKGVPDYRGPQTSGHLASIKNTDDRSVTFTLTRPYALFDQTMALPQFAPIDRAHDVNLRDQGVSYASDPSSNGPFTISVSSDRQSVNFARNKYWTQTSDSVRTPRVKAMKWKIFDKEAELDSAVLRGAVDVRLDGGLGSDARETVAKTSSLTRYVDRPSTGAVNYLALIPTAAPLDRLACRQAIAQALDISELITIRGGTDVMRTTDKMSSPRLPGALSGGHGAPEPTTGDLDAARSKLLECGYPDGFEIRMAYVNLGVGQSTYESVQRSLSRIGIVVDPVKYATFSEYFSSGVGAPSTVHDKQIGIVASSWSPEGTSPLSFWGPIADGRKVKTRANVNYPEFQDDTVKHLLDELELGNPDIARLSEAIDGAVMASGYYVPFAVEQMVLYRGPQLANAYVQWALGAHYDIVNLGVNRSDS
jgi:peptide/nickel transport system substrate-binding protein